MVKIQNQKIAKTMKKQSTKMSVVSCKTIVSPKKDIRDWDDWG